MTKGFTSEEFIKYVSGLKFGDIRYVIAFMEAYRDAYYDAIDKGDNDLVGEAFLKYSLTMAILGPHLIRFANIILGENNADDQKVQSGA